MSRYEQQAAQSTELLDQYHMYNSNYFYNCYYSGSGTLPTPKKNGVTGSILGLSGGASDLTSSSTLPTRKKSGVTGSILGLSGSTCGLTSSSTLPIQKKKGVAGSRLLGLSGGASGLASFGSMANLRSDTRDKVDYEILGEVLVGVQYKDGQLYVHVNRARGLAAADSNGFSDPYVKTYLLPDRSKHSKRKTSIKKKTLDPVYDETLKYKVSPMDIGNRTLWLSVWDWDRFSHNRFLGEVRLPLAMNLKDGTDRWYSLVDKEGEDETDTYHGQVKIGLMFTPITNKKSGKTVGTLSIMIKQARDLPQMDAMGGLADSYIKCHLLPDRSSRGKCKTAVVKNSLNPVWEERFTYEKVVLEELTTERVLEITTWDFNKGSRNDFIGGIRIGPLAPRIGRRKEWMDSIGDEVSHWETMLACPGRWVEQWHTFRTTMDPRSVLLV